MYVSFSDLMLPGVVKVEKGGCELERIRKGELCAVNLVGNRCVCVHACVVYMYVGVVVTVIFMMPSRVYALIGTSLSMHTRTSESDCVSMSVL